MNIDTKITSRQIYLTSSSADRHNNGNNSDSMWFFKDTITVPESINIMLSVIDAQIPLTFYSIAEGRNQLKFKVTGYQENAQQVVDVSDGNYNITELLEVVNLHPGLTENNIVASYKTKTNKITFKASDSALRFDLENSSLLKHLGFSNRLHESQTGEITSDRGVNVNGISSVYIATNLTTKNLDSRRAGFSNIISKIPVNTAFNGMIFYQPSVKFSTEIAEKQLSFIRLTLQDDISGNTLDINNVDWSCTLQLDFVQDDTTSKFASLTTEVLSPDTTERLSASEKENNVFEAQLVRLKGSLQSQATGF